MEDLTLILVGTTLVMWGWYWGGLTEGQSTAGAAGIPALLLGGIVIFGGPQDTHTWAFAALAATFGAMIALGSLWETGTDRGLGLFALLFALIGVFVLIAQLDAAGNALTTQSLGTILLTLALAFVFISSALTPAQKGFRSFVGWLVLLVGAGLVFLGFAPSLNITL